MFHLDRDRVRSLHDRLSRCGLHMLESGINNIMALFGRINVSFFHGAHDLAFLKQLPITYG